MLGKLTRAVRINIRVAYNYTGGLHRYIRMHARSVRIGVISVLLTVMLLGMHVVFVIYTGKVHSTEVTRYAC